MKKLMVLIVIIMLCAIPATVLADGPTPSPYANYPYGNYILIDDYTKVTSVEIWGHDIDGNYIQIKQNITEFETKVPCERVIYFYNGSEKFNNFQIVIVLNSGEKITSNLASFGCYGKSNFRNFGDAANFGSYIYSVKDNTLKPGNIINWKPDGVIIFYTSFMLLFSLLLTVIAEWLISLAFRLKPDTHVVVTNSITKPVMSVLLMLIFINFIFNYYLALTILEVLVTGAEFWYYTRKYKGYTKKRLLLFTVTANLASWLLYWFLSPLLH